MCAVAMHASELDYELPPELIAQAPLPERDASRMLCLRRGVASVEHALVRDLPERLPEALLVLNDTRVLRGRLRAYKPTGGRIEVLLVQRLSDPGAHERWLALGRTRGLREGVAARVPGANLSLTITRRLGNGEFEVEVDAEPSVAAALAAHGEVPLPPYIRRAPDALDATRYQTVFAAHDGAIAAPTAGLHLSEALLARLCARGHELAYVTLHVGPGTFAPLRSDELARHRMHQERYVIPAAAVRAIARAKAARRPVVAVGTTVVRALEASARRHGTVAEGEGETDIFIYPPYRFLVADALLTNFHLPRSTLLALVMAFAGVDAVREAYAQAIAARYRFFSYGDAMLITGAS